MIITRTPFRISFFGGGTDYPTWCDEHGGAVLSVTIDKYCYIMCRYLLPFFKYDYNIRYRLKEITNDLNKIKHPTVRETLKFLNVKRGIEMVHTADLPARAGIGSSSSFTVGFLHAVNALLGKIVTKRQLALDAIYIEQNLIKENIGCQDQAAASFGGFNKIEFGGPNKICVNPISLSKNNIKLLESNLMLFFTGLSRTASNIAKKYIKDLPKKEVELNIMRELVDIAIEALQENDLNKFGMLLHESWNVKKRLSNVISNDFIDSVYDFAMKNGALGGKLCGAGAGGFLLLYVPKEKQEKIKVGLKDLLYVPFKFDFLGSQIILYHVQ